MLKDMQGRILAKGDRVAFVAYHNANEMSRSLTIGRIVGLGKTRAHVKYIAFYEEANEMVHTSELIKL